MEKLIAAFTWPESLVIGIVFLLVIPIATYLAKLYLDKKFEIHKDASIEKIRHANQTLAAKLNHRLSLSFDKAKIVHENQKEALGKVFGLLSTALAECRGAYSFEREAHLLFSSDRLQKISKEVYADSLFVNSNSFQIVSVILDILGRNSDQIYQLVGPDESYSFDEFDLSLLDCLVAVLFISFRHQLGIEEMEITAGAVESWTKVSELSAFPIDWKKYELSDLFAGAADPDKLREAILAGGQTRDLLESALSAEIQEAKDIPKTRGRMELVLKYLEGLDGKLF